MNCKRIATLSLAAAGVLAMNAGFADIGTSNWGLNAGNTTTTNGSACLSDALREGGYVLQEVKRLFNTYHNNELETITTAYNDFQLGTDDSATVSGLVWSKFGKNMVSNGKGGSDVALGTSKYVFVAYMGKRCGALSNTKLMCDLMKDQSGGTGPTGALAASNVFGNTTTFSSDNRQGFWMNCRICTGVKLGTSNQGNEESATNATRFYANELATAENLQKADVANAAHSGLVVGETVSTWISGDTCSATPDDQSTV